MLEIKVQQDNEKTLLEILREMGTYLPAVCAGRGTCGKCRVKVLQGEAPISEADKKFFSCEELQEGFRLSCKLVPKSELVVSVMDTDEDKISVVGAGDKKLYPAPESNVLGIDIGTTTIAMLFAGEEYLAVNRQRMYGADVISRIKASTEGRGAELQRSIRKDLWTGIVKLTEYGTRLPDRIVIAANTTMIHLLMGYPCDGLGVYPFTPYNIEAICSDIRAVLGYAAELLKGAYINEEFYNTPVHILPGISAFVGADIVSDMLVCGISKSSKVDMLIDLGTNGEMVIGNKDKILVTSTAAGPAFEGGNIICGTGSVPGAISGAEIKENKIRLKTIMNVEPVGICGTGVIEVLYELLKAGIVDETGYMEEEKVVLHENDEGEQICFYRQDVRELQLAKSAIRAGAETLMLHYGVTAQEIGTVYLAGGFGYYINIEKAVGIGLFPEEFKDKIKVIGNASLKGTFIYNIDSKEESGKPVEVELANDKKFSELYMEYMFF